MMFRCNQESVESGHLWQNLPSVIAPGRPPEAGTIVCSGGAGMFSIGIDLLPGDVVMLSGSMVSEGASGSMSGIGASVIFEISIAPFGVLP